MADYNLSCKFKKIVIAVCIISMILLVGLYVYMYMPLSNDHYLSIDNKGVSMDKYPIANRLSLTTTTVNIMDSHCMVYAVIYDDVTDMDDYSIKSDYYDSNGNLIDSTNVKMSDIKKEGDELLLIDYTSDKVIASVEITIFDENDTQVYNVLIGED